MQPNEEFDRLKERPESTEEILRDKKKNSTLQVFH